ncbi:tRNA (adenine-N(1)-)-methyltransferase catalytic subunit trm61 [Zalaria obscura]|uniref:tRNA (Adenine-N(1)-)-methyltransferase catalytic subunit trm61 n=1 Tax=Zalaria obscura TaxID=2024903 RepID=A0ACC3SBB5_9PEZI
MATSKTRHSPFFNPGETATAESLAILHLRRDQLVPVILSDPTNNADGYAEGAVTNTRFGSFPHSTLVNLPWGSQVLASKVDTGSRGRKGNKRKRDETDSDANTPTGGREAGEDVKTAIAAGSGFIHLLPPTPESWTVSLPHRTQVVYTPDYSYVLQRLRVRPGQTIIEAGAGSGSFTHASARAVFNGYPSASEPAQKKRKYGRVCSFEYHEPRANTLRGEMTAHGLDDVVTVTHRDVYADGFNLGEDKSESPKANAVFLDLPAPWLALKHLSRRRVPPKTAQAVTHPETESPAPENTTSSSTPTTTSQDTSPFISPLNPKTPTYLCTFSPCIEQVTATTAALRRLGWTEIEMVEVQHKRVEVRRERIGLHEEGLRGVNSSAANVAEAVGRLREVEGRFKEWNEGPKDGSQAQALKVGRGPDGKSVGGSKAERLAKIKEEFESRKIYKEGRLVHRTENEIKTHTSYLTFAILPREWTEEDEEQCRKKWVADAKVVPTNGKENGKKGKTQVKGQSSKQDGEESK